MKEYVPKIPNDIPKDPVGPKTEGYGWPYAPQDFPLPGDKWKWKAGNKSKDGYWQIRSLLLPERIVSESKTNYEFFTKMTVKEFLRANFPSLVLNSFFESFQWKIPAISSVETSETGKIACENQKIQTEKNQTEKNQTEKIQAKKIKNEKTQTEKIQTGLKYFPSKTSKKNERRPQERVMEKQTVKKKLKTEVKCFPSLKSNQVNSNFFQSNPAPNFHVLENDNGNVNGNDQSNANDNGNGYDNCNDDNNDTDNDNDDGKNHFHAQYCFSGIEKDKNEKMKDKDGEDVRCEMNTDVITIHKENQEEKELEKKKEKQKLKEREETEKETVNEKETRKLKQREKVTEKEMQNMETDEKVKEKEIMKEKEKGRKRLKGKEIEIQKLVSNVNESHDRTSSDHLKIKLKNDKIDFASPSTHTNQSKENINSYFQNQNNNNSNMQSKNRQLQFLLTQNSQHYIQNKKCMLCSNSFIMVDKRKEKNLRSNSMKEIDCLDLNIEISNEDELNREHEMHVDPFIPNKNGKGKEREEKKEKGKEKEKEKEKENHDLDDMGKNAYDAGIAFWPPIILCKRLNARGQSCNHAVHMNCALNSNSRKFIFSYQSDIVYFCKICKNVSNFRPFISILLNSMVSFSENEKSIQCLQYICQCFENNELEHIFQNALKKVNVNRFDINTAFYEIKLEIIKHSKNETGNENNMKRKRDDIKSNLNCLNTFDNTTSMHKRIKSYEQLSPSILNTNSNVRRPYPRPGDVASSPDSNNDIIVKLDADMDNQILQSISNFNSNVEKRLLTQKINVLNHKNEVLKEFQRSFSLNPSNFDEYNNQISKLASLQQKCHKEEKLFNDMIHSMDVDIVFSGGRNMNENILQNLNKRLMFVNRGENVNDDGSNGLENKDEEKKKEFGDGDASFVKRLVLVGGKENANDEMENKGEKNEEIEYGEEVKDAIESGEYKDEDKMEDHKEEERKGNQIKDEEKESGVKRKKQKEEEEKRKKQKEEEEMEKDYTKKNDILNEIINDREKSIRQTEKIDQIQELEIKKDRILSVEVKAMMHKMNDCDEKKRNDYHYNDKNHSENGKKVKEGDGRNVKECDIDREVIKENGFNSDVNDKKGNEKNVDEYGVNREVIKENDFNGDGNEKDVMNHENDCVKRMVIDNGIMEEKLSNSKLTKENEIEYFKKNVAIEKFMDKEMKVNDTSEEENMGKEKDDKNEEIKGKEEEKEKERPVIADIEMGNLTNESKNNELIGIEKDEMNRDCSDNMDELEKEKEKMKGKKKRKEKEKGKKKRKEKEKGKEKEKEKEKEKGKGEKKKNEKEKGKEKEELIQMGGDGDKDEESEIEKEGEKEEETEKQTERQKEKGKEKEKRDNASNDKVYLISDTEPFILNKMKNKTDIDVYVYVSDDDMHKKGLEKVNIFSSNTVSKSCVKRNSKLIQNEMDFIEYEMLDGCIEEKRKHGKKVKEDEMQKGKEVFETEEIKNAEKEKEGKETKEKETKGKEKEGKEAKEKETKVKETKGKETKGKDKEVIATKENENVEKEKEKERKETKEKEKEGKETKEKEKEGKETKGKEKKGEGKEVIEIKNNENVEKGKEKEGKESKGKESKGKESKGKEKEELGGKGKDMRKKKLKRENETKKVMKCDKEEKEKGETQMEEEMKEGEMVEEVELENDFSVKDNHENDNIKDDIMNSNDTNMTIGNELKEMKSKNTLVCNDEAMIENQSSLSNAMIKNKEVDGERMDGLKDKEERVMVNYQPSHLNLICESNEDEGQTHAVITGEEEQMVMVDDQTSDFNGMLGNDNNVINNNEKEKKKKKNGNNIGSSNDKVDGESIVVFKDKEMKSDKGMKISMEEGKMEAEKNQKEKGEGEKEEGKGSEKEGGKEKEKVKHDMDAGREKVKEKKLRIVNEKDRMKKEDENHGRKNITQVEKEGKYKETLDGKVKEEKKQENEEGKEKGDEKEKGEEGKGEEKEKREKEKGEKEKEEKDGGKGKEEVNQTSNLVLDLITNNPYEKLWEGSISAYKEKVPYNLLHLQMFGAKYSLKCDFSNFTRLVIARMPLKRYLIECLSLKFRSSYETVFLLPTEEANNCQLLLESRFLLIRIPTYYDLVITTPVGNLKAPTGFLLGLVFPKETKVFTTAFMNKFSARKR